MSSNLILIVKIFIFDYVLRFSRSITRLARRPRRNRLRALMRGYSRLKDRSQLAMIQDLIQTLRETCLAIPSEKYSRRIFGSAVSQSDLVIRQLLIRNEHMIVGALLSERGGRYKVRLPLPKKWLRVIESNGFKVDYFWSSIFLFFYGTKQLFIGCVQVIINIKQNFKLRAEEIASFEPFVYFVDLVDTNLACPSGSQNSFCIVNWYLQWSGRRTDIKLVRHGVANSRSKKIGSATVEYQKSPLPIILGLRSLCRYLCWVIYAVAISFFDLVRGRWWHALLLREASSATLVRLCNVKTLARQYFFHNSGYYPPLWIFELPDTGSEAIFYWYTTNSEPFKLHTSIASFNTPYSIMNWPRYLVWDEGQAQFVRRCDKNDPVIEIVGPIWFQDSGKSVADVPGFKIALFDVQPYRASRYRLLAPSFEYYVPAIANKFVLDVVNIALEMNARVLWKRKRDIGKLIHPAFARCASSVSEREHILVISPDISAFRVIKKADIVISMPFTSTALIANNMGKPTIYYDPLSMLKADDPAAHGVPIVQGKKELNYWLSLRMMGV